MYPTLTEIEYEKDSLQGNGSGSTLLCPVCGSNNLHQERYDMDVRHEDKCGQSISQGAYEGLPDVDSGYIGFGRRHSISIHFSCEVCSQPNDGYDLVIYQHKGSTIFGWLLHR